MGHGCQGAVHQHSGCRGSGLVSIGISAHYELIGALLRLTKKECKDACSPWIEPVSSLSLSISCFLCASLPCFLPFSLPPWLPPFFFRFNLLYLDSCLSYSSLISLLFLFPFCASPPLSQSQFVPLSLLSLFRSVCQIGDISPLLNSAGCPVLIAFSDLAAC